MPSRSPTSIQLSRLVLCAAVAVGVSIASIDADAQRGGNGRPSGGSHGGKPGWSGGGGHWSGGGNWNGGGHGRWNGGGRHWNGGGHGHWNGGGRHWNAGHGGHWRGHHHGWYGGSYYYPGWALGVGVGVGLTYPWWGWGWNYPYYVNAYPSSYVYDRVYEAPVGVAVDRAGPPASAPAPAYRWYCTSPQGYHPDVVECAAGWLKVLPDAGPPSAPLPPRSSAPNGVTPRIAPGTMGNAAPPRIAAPRMTRPTQLAGAETRLAHGTTD